MEKERIHDNYVLETECDGLILHIIRVSDGECIATLDRLSAEIMEYWEYSDIMETITCVYNKDEFPVLQYFFGWYFSRI